MSQRTRTVQYIEGRILNVLARTTKGKEPTSLALCAMAMKYELRSLEEQHNYDLALYNLLRKKVIVQTQDEKGFRVLKLAA